MLGGIKNLVFTKASSTDEEENPFPSIVKFDENYNGGDHSSNFLEDYATKDHSKPTIFYIIKNMEMMSNEYDDTINPHILTLIKKFKKDLVKGKVKSNNIKKKETNSKKIKKTPAYIG